MRKENFDHLRNLGVELADGRTAENAIWSLELKHSQWGEASLVNLRNIPLPPQTLIECDAGLIPEEVQDIASCGTAVSLLMMSTKGHVLQDRKNALCFLNAVLGDEGVACLDHVAQKFWPRGALEIETAHAAVLDVDGIMCYHAVTAQDGETVHWLHSHGLGEIGFFDFDVLRPAEDLQSNAHDLLRCIGFDILEGSVQPGGTFEPLGGAASIRAVKATDFMARAAPKDAALRDDPGGDHVEKRVVLCDADEGGFRRFLGGKPRPSRVLSRPFKPENLIQFSNDASRLMAERAQMTFDSFVQIAAELAEFDCGAMVKLGYRIDGGEDGDNEHLWFDYHGMMGTKIDATLLNQPFRIGRMREGQRALHSAELLSDWGILTPGGTINPRATRPLRFIRRHKEELRAALKDAPDSPLGKADPR